MKRIGFFIVVFFAFLTINVTNAQAVNSSYTLRPYYGQPSVHTGLVQKSDWDSAVVNNKSGLGWGRSVAFRVRDNAMDYATGAIDANNNGKYYLAYMQGKAVNGAFYYLFSSRNSGSGDVSGVWAP